MAYSDSNYYLVSRVISQKTGRNLHELARELLFNPLGITATAWAACPQGYSMGATGLFLSIRDMTKLGVMLLQDGAWNGNQIVPREWIAEMTKKHTSINDPAYGYGFWLNEETGDYCATGMLGQLIQVSPKKGRVIAIQSCTHDDENFGKLFALLGD